MSNCDDKQIIVMNMGKDKTAPFFLKLSDLAE